MPPSNTPLSQIRSGEELDFQLVRAFIQENLPEYGELKAIHQFGGGYSNLTYLLQTQKADLVLRKPPKGAEHIKGGHDMGREFIILQNLAAAGFYQIPKALLFSSQKGLLGTPFYIMEKVEGIILRPSVAHIIQKDFKAETLKKIAENIARTQASLHGIDVENNGLIGLGKPEGYTERQVMGWQGRYQKAETENLALIPAIGKWLTENLPKPQRVSLLHNDFKFDNLVLDQTKPEIIKAILDWEMSSIGDPLMDLGTTLAYWVSPTDDIFMKSFNISWLPGCIDKNAYIEIYEKYSGLALDKLLFYYVFGLFKNAVILQQIYARYQQGLSQDGRFAQLNIGVKLLAEKAAKAINTDKLA